jgi:hypothetical protein
MISYGATFQLVSTFNEWGEGTAIESASEWATASGFGAYLDALHFNGNFNGGQPVAEGIGRSFAHVAVGIGAGVAAALATITISEKPSVVCEKRE